MEFIQGFSYNNSVKIHYIDNKVNNTEKTTLLICPGLSESAEDYLKLISNLGDRRCIALSFRGRGKSQTPLNGYTLEDHIDDIGAVVNDLGLNSFCIMGYSRGVSYTLGYSMLNNNKLKGLIIGEYPPLHKKMPLGWAKESMEFYNENCSSISITYNALKSIEEDSREVNFENNLSSINCKTLILKGEKVDTLLSKENLNTYINNLNSKSIRIEIFEKSGHDIQSTDFQKLCHSINDFLLSTDKKN